MTLYNNKLFMNEAQFEYILNHIDCCVDYDDWNRCFVLTLNNNGGVGVIVSDDRV